MPGFVSSEKTGFRNFPSKAGVLADLVDIEWHMIGHLQTNKAARAAELFTAVDSVDSLRLAEKLNSSAQQMGKKLSAFIEINVGGETAKSGISPESRELDEIFQAAPNLQHLNIRGLMTVPPFFTDPQEARPYFRKLRELHDGIKSRNLSNVSMEVISMGMSHDFEVAIEEGATCVRIGTAIFGERVKP